MLAKHLGVKPEVSTEVPKKAMNSVKDEYIIVDAPTNPPILVHIHWNLPSGILRTPLAACLRFNSFAMAAKAVR